MTVRPETPGRPAAGVRAEAAALALLLLGVVRVHGAGLARPFFADDYLFLEQVRGRSLPAALLAPDPLGNFFRPVGRALYFWLVARLGGETPLVFHAVGLALFLAALLAFHAIARRLAGRGAALFATALVALHHAADVPLRWASGSQDLLAILFALLAVALHLRGRRAWAVPALLLALLSKEVVAGAAVVAIVADRAPGERWRAAVRRGLPLLAATAAWAVAWGWHLSRHPQPAGALAAGPGGALATLVHLPQVLAGLEFRLGGRMLGHFSALSLLPAALAAAVLAWGAGRDDVVADAGPRSRALVTGGAWMLAGLVPLVPVAHLWSAYFYLWALFGAALLAAAATARLGPAARIALLAGLVFLSDGARRLDEFAPAPGAWTWQSHVNRHHVDRALATIDGFLRQMRAARPTLPPRATVFFANVPVSSTWQAADGPLVRWAYRDTSLRSYFLGQFTRERAARGPLFFLAVEGDSLVDRTGDPALLRTFAFSMLLADRSGAATDALDRALDDAPADRELRYWRAWARWGAGDTLAARGDLLAAGLAPGAGLPAGAEAALPAAADTAARLAALVRLRAAAATSPWVHARLAAALLGSGRVDEGVIEACAYRVLAPGEPDAWRKWASAQLAKEQYEPALRSLERYLALAGARGGRDAEAEQVVASLRRLVRGDLAQRALR